MASIAKKDQAHEILIAEITSQELSDEALENITGGANPAVTEELFGNYYFLLPHIEQENLYKTPKK